jgi:putative transposase
MRMKDSLMKIAVKVHDVVALAKRFELAPAEAWREVVEHMRESVVATLEQVMNAELELFLGQQPKGANKRNGFTTRTYAVKGLGAVRVRVPRDRRASSSPRWCPRTGTTTRRRSGIWPCCTWRVCRRGCCPHVSGRVLGIRVSPQEVSNALKTIVPAAKKFLERPLGGRRWQYLYIDGTNFHVRRGTVALEPTLVVIGVDELGHKSVLSMVQGDKDSRGAWEMVFSDLKERGLDSSAVLLGIMDGLPGLGTAFTEAFPRARVARCWVHKARNVFPRVPKRFQAEFKVGWDAVQYAESGEAARAAFKAMKERWKGIADDAIACFERDIEALLAHYSFPREHWEAIRTTNPIERVNKEFKRRSKAMDSMGADGLKALLAFTAMRLEFGWSTTAITSNKLTHLQYRERLEERRTEAMRSLLN